MAYLEHALHYIYKFYYVNQIHLVNRHDLNQTKDRNRHFQQFFQRARCKTFLSMMYKKCSIVMTHNL